MRTSPEVRSRRWPLGIVILALVTSSALSGCQDTQQADERFCRSTLAAGRGLSELARLPEAPERASLEGAVGRIDGYLDDIASDWPSGLEPLIDRFVTAFRRIDASLEAGDRPAAADVAQARSSAEEILDAAETHCGFELPG